ncbi:MsnO8 family LLM class oxidoreductase [Saccharopolyspora dendranthemae]|uniref:Luciferase family oxidoreductase group 1 n=1 Tax=Saccharopolyspora dendranthemae TaxID=1181886 RepID=A0A561U8U6_9PSEU|nr:MsnO8 family LLM class oxidoreductase [Saccharopolyspora dendranthemae]TWF95757.1 luciferase family oxidoreductase group 1 [Saccharopolyspora dendranthemae]
MPVPLSVLDLSPIASGQTAKEALHNTLDLARRTEAFGYRRYWVAEHHLTAGVASAAPAVLLTAIAGATSTIRVGSAAVLLGQHSPLTVAEQFGTLAQLHPGRVDLGVGRSGKKRAQELAERLTAPARNEGSTVDGLIVPAKPRAVARSERYAARLRQQAELVGAPAEELDYRDQVSRVRQFLEGGFPGPDGEPVRANPAEGADLELWILGSSGGESAVTAGRLGIPFAASYHITPATVLETVESYRENFVASDRLDRPYVVVSADVVVADSSERARELASPYGAWVHSIRAGAGAIPYPSPAEVADLPWDEEAREIVADRLATQFVGTPEEVVGRLVTLREATGADELVVTTITHDHADRVRSYELLAEAWNRT